VDFLLMTFIQEIDLELNNMFDIMFDLLRRPFSMAMMFS
jgi:hypothetical protein